MLNRLHIIMLRFVFTLMIGMAAFSVASYADDPLCDNDLWTQMTQRGRLNGQMDVARAENLIYKADSILEYVCMERFIDQVPANISYYMTYAPINNLTKPTIQNWVFTNFGHTYLGGRVPPGDPNLPASGEPYDCSAMQYVWTIAHCMDYADLPPQDNMLSAFDFLNAPDMRLLPQACQAPDPAAYGLAPVPVPVPVLITTNMPTPDCGIPIPTGNTIDFSETTAQAYPNVFPQLGGGGRVYKEKICSNPGCHYMPTGMDSGSCEPPNPPVTP